MANYTVDHACGHTQDVNITGPVRTRESRRAWLAGRVCPDCYRRSQEEERAAAAVAAAAAAAAAGLPTLTGSERQVAWAERIRQGLADRMGEALSQMAAAGSPLGDDRALAACGPTDLAAIGVLADRLDECGGPAAAAAAAARAYREVMSGRTSASWWIDHRDNLSRPGQLPRLLAAE